MSSDTGGGVTGAQGEYGWCCEAIQDALLANIFAGQWRGLASGMLHF